MTRYSKIIEFLSRCNLPRADYMKAIREPGCYVVCARFNGHTLLHADNKTGMCALCRHPIEFRPYNEVARMKFCLECAMAISEEAN